MGIIMKMKSCADGKIGKLYFYELLESRAAWLWRFRCKVKGTQVWGVLLLCPRWSSPCGRRPSCVFETSTLQKGYSPQLDREQEERAQVSFEEPRPSTSFLLETWVWKGTFFNAVSYAMLHRHQNNLLWNDLFLLWSPNPKWNVYACVWWLSPPQVWIKLPHNWAE